MVTLPRDTQHEGGSMAGVDDMIESGLNSILGKSGDQAIDLPEWAGPALMGVIGAIGGKAVGGAAGGTGGLGAVVGGLLGTAAGSGGLQGLIDKFSNAGAERAGEVVGRDRAEPGRRRSNRGEGAGKRHDLGARRRGGNYAGGGQGDSRNRDPGGRRQDDPRGSSSRLCSARSRGHEGRRRVARRASPLSGT